jgi:hypothetical protein
VSSTLQSGKVCIRLHRKEKDGSVGKLYLPMSQVFDAIKDIHDHQLAHLKGDPTHVAIPLAEKLFQEKHLLLCTVC